MVYLEEAYEIAKDFFLKNGYIGVDEARETDSSWLFNGKSEQSIYGTSEVCVPKNGDEPYVFNIAHEEGAAMWENAEAIHL